MALTYDIPINIKVLADSEEEAIQMALESFRNYVQILPWVMRNIKEVSLFDFGTEDGSNIV